METREITKIEERMKGEDGLEWGSQHNDVMKGSVSVQYHNDTLSRVALGMIMLMIT